uniref:Uncharacterized protein n=1 Tax=Arundo donax TaxID=35708 RepID=A0A0A8Y3M5_ARUDO
MSVQNSLRLTYP